MAVTGLHLLLTYQCTHQCDHCFVFGSPGARGHFSLELIQKVFAGAESLGSVESVAFEGGEPFLLYPLLCAAVQEATRRSWRVDIVTNAYWATSEEAAEQCLAPLATAGLGKLSVSTDALHGNPQEAAHAAAAAAKLGVTCGTLTTQPGKVMHRGRAAVTLADARPQQEWSSFDRCPYESLAEPRRVHLDAGGHLHICQGLLMGNYLSSPLQRVVNGYRPMEHPVIGPLLVGGPAELVRCYRLPHRDTYADACHLCYHMRGQLRQRFGALLAPGQVYGDLGNME